MLGLLYFLVSPFSHVSIVPRVSRDTKGILVSAEWHTQVHLKGGEGGGLMIFCARATRGRGLPSLDARNRRSISPHPLKRQRASLEGALISLDARSEALSVLHPEQGGAGLSIFFNQPEP